MVPLHHMPDVALVLFVMVPVMRVREIAREQTNKRDEERERERERETEGEIQRKLEI